MNTPLGSSGGRRPTPRATLHTQLLTEALGLLWHMTSQGPTWPHGTPSVIGSSCSCSFHCLLSGWAGAKRGHGHGQAPGCGQPLHCTPADGWRAPGSGARLTGLNPSSALTVCVSFGKLPNLSKCASLSPSGNHACLAELL